MCDVKSMCEGQKITHDILMEVRKNLCTPEGASITGWSKNFTSFAYLLAQQVKDNVYTEDIYL